MSGTISTRWYFTDWMSDEGVRASSLAARGLWIDLLCIAGNNRDREHGFVLIAGKVPTTTQLARRLGATDEEIESLLEELANNRVFNRDKRGAIYCRRMVRAEKYRGNGRLGGVPKPTENKENKKAPPLPIPKPKPEPKNKNSPSESPPIDGELFPSPLKSDWPEDYRERFWRTYPRKTEKKAALAKLDAIRKEGKVPWAVFVAGLLRHAAHVSGTEERYIKHPTTWLNRGCWDDEHTAPGLRGGERRGGGAGHAAIAVELLKRGGFDASDDADEDDGGALPTLTFR